MTTSPRQSDLLLVAGKVNHKTASLLRTCYEQMPNPKWVVAIGNCAISGGIFANYATVQGIAHILPVDLYIVGCPPRPETLIDGILQLKSKIQNE